MNARHSLGFLRFDRFACPRFSVACSLLSASAVAVADNTSGGPRLYALLLGSMSKRVGIYISPTYGLSECDGISYTFVLIYYLFDVRTPLVLFLVSDLLMLPFYFALGRWQLLPPVLGFAALGSIASGLAG